MQELRGERGSARSRHMMKRRRARRYTGILQFFHNYEHDPLGRNHCKGPASNPYAIAHVNGRHKISHRYAVGHGRGGVRQWFVFVEPLEDGFNLASGRRVSREPTPEQKVLTR